MAATATTPHTGRLTDEQLVAHARAGDDRAVAELLRRYGGAARAQARSYFVLGGDRDDTVQEGMIGLYEAVRDYAPERGASFRSFAELCIRRRILTAVRSATRRKHAPLNGYVSLDVPTDVAGEGGLAAAALVDDADPLEGLVAADEVRLLWTACQEVLSDLEADVLALHVEGRSYREIASALNRRTRSVDNALQRVKRKLAPHVRHVVDVR